MSLSTSDTTAHIWEIFLFFSLFFSFSHECESGRGGGSQASPPPTLKTVQSQLKSNVTQHQWNIKSISCLRAYAAHVRGSTYWSSCERINIKKKLISFEWTERPRKTSNKRMKLTFFFFNGCVLVFGGLPPRYPALSSGFLLSLPSRLFPRSFSVAVARLSVCEFSFFLSKGMGMGEEVTRGAQSWIKVDCRLYQTRLNMSDLTVTSTNTGESLFSIIVDYSAQSYAVILVY